MSYELTYEDYTYYLSFSGVVSLNEIIKANGIIQGDKDFDYHKNQVIDLREADFSNIEETDGRLLGATDAVASRICSNVKIVIIVTEPKALAFCESYIETSKHYKSPWSFQLSPDMETALSWLSTQP